jgi:molybdopterin-biosynthesis enzyme MoeA-like protein
LVTHPQLAELIQAHFPEPRHPAMKMAEVPEGAVLNDAGDARFPTVQLENVYILPGIPQIFERKLMALLERFATDPYFLRIIYSSAGEGTLAGPLNECLKDFPDLMLGSYPRIGDPAYRVKLTLESKDAEYLDRALDRLIELLPRDAIVKIE